MEGSSWNDDPRIPNNSFPEKRTLQHSQSSPEEVLLKLLHALQSSSDSGNQNTHSVPSDFANTAKASADGKMDSRPNPLDLKPYLPKATSLASQYTESFPHFASLPQSPTAGKMQSSALDDGQDWRKYGQKQAKGAAFPRAYYRCAIHGCPAKKTVEKMADGAYDILYKEEHDHSGKRALGRGRIKLDDNNMDFKDGDRNDFLGFSRAAATLAGDDNVLQERLKAALLQEAILQVKAATAQQQQQQQQSMYSQAENNRNQGNFDLGPGSGSGEPLRRMGSMGDMGDLFDMVNGRSSNMQSSSVNDYPPQPEIELPTARSMGMTETMRVTPKFGEFLPLPQLKMDSNFSGMFSSGPLGPPPPGQNSRHSAVPANQGGFSGFEFFQAEAARNSSGNKPEDWDLGAVVGQTLSGRTNSDIAAIPVSNPVVPQWQKREGWEGIGVSGGGPGLRSEPASPLSGSWSPAASSYSNFSQFDDVEVSSGIGSSLPQSPVKRKDIMDEFDPSFGGMISSDIAMKKRRMVSALKRTVRLPLEEEALEDGYKWRKYGKKVIKDTPFERSYFRCTKEGCEARKRVERSQSEPDVLLVTYEGQHTHNPSLFKARVRHNVEDDSTGEATGVYNSVVGAIASLAVKSEPSSPSRAGIAWQGHVASAHPFVDVRAQERIAEPSQMSDVQFEKDLKELSKFNLHDLGFDD